MSDRRTTPDPALVEGAREAIIGAPLTDLCAGPGGARDRQLLLGDPVTVLGEAGASSYVRSDKDGYVGWLDTAALTQSAAPTHIVTAPATHAYAAPDIKRPDLATLSFGCRLTALTETGDFVETALGHVPKKHLRTADWRGTDPAAIALRFAGTPYLWGGNSRQGLDCSGLVQAALLACGLPCPGDSDLQMAHLPRVDVADRRGDLIFWTGHVALLVDAETLIHANAHHMAVTVEPRREATDRISQKEFGAVLGFARPSLMTRSLG